MRICPVVTVQLVPSATTTTSGSAPARRRAASTPRPSLIWRQPRTSTSKPPRRSCATAPSITESPTASGGAPGAAQLRRLEVLDAAARRLAAGGGCRHGGRERAYYRRAQVVFPSFEFAFFFPVVLALSWALMPRPRLWKPFILGGQLRLLRGRQPALLPAARGRYLGQPGGRGCWCTAPTTSAAASGSSPPRWRSTSACSGLFKYYGFFADEIGAFLDTLGLGMPLPLLTLALPIGLSFITFQAISYVVDVKRGLLPPAALIDFAIYLSFFPHVVAGPIVRAREFIPQLAKPRDPRDVAVGAGVVLIALGLVKKVALADYLAREVVDPVFGVPEAYSRPDVALAAYAYAAQIYCDFSGYTDIAIGVALLMGFVFPQNFNSPYRATSFRDFWRRWHMTLSRFLRDFLYIPLGRQPRRQVADRPQPDDHDGARRALARRRLGLRPLGHPARPRARDRAPPARPRRRPRLAALGDRLQRRGVRLDPVPRRDLDLAGTFLSQLFDPGPATLWTPVMVAVVIGVIGFQLLPPDPLERLRVRVAELPDYALGLGLAVVVAVVGATVPSQGVPPFIYFQF